MTLTPDETTPPRIGFMAALNESSIKKSVWWTLAVMHDHAHDGHVTLSKAHLANLLGTSERTIQRHWATAVEAGFLTKYDHPKRPSCFHLWPGTASVTPEGDCEECSNPTESETTE